MRVPLLQQWARRAVLSLGLALVLVAARFVFALFAGLGAAVDNAPDPALDRPVTVAAGARPGSTAVAAGGAPAAPLFPDDAPADLQIPRETARRLRAPLEPWVFAWRTGIGSFRLGQLGRTRVRPLPEPDPEPYDGNAAGEDLRLLHLALPAPTTSLLLDPYLDLELSGEGNAVRARRDVLGGVALVDLRARTRRRVLASPPGGRFDGGYWLDDDSFVVLAAEPIAPNPFRGGPVLYLVDLERRTVTRYAGPGADFPTFRAVQGELDRRFRVAHPAVLLARS